MNKVKKSTRKINPSNHPIHFRKLPPGPDWISWWAAPGPRAACLTPLTYSVGAHNVASLVLSKLKCSSPTSCDNVTFEFLLTTDTQRIASLRRGLPSDHVFRAGCRSICPGSAPELRGLRLHRRWCIQPYQHYRDRSSAKTERDM